MIKDETFNYTENFDGSEYQKNLKDLSPSKGTPSSRTQIFSVAQSGETN